jgi:hypothetical protein
MGAGAYWYIGVLTAAMAAVGSLARLPPRAARTVPPAEATFNISEKLPVYAFPLAAPMHASLAPHAHLSAESARRAVHTD